MYHVQLCVFMALWQEQYVSIAPLLNLKIS